MERQLSEDDLLTTAEVATLARVTRSTVCRWADDGAIPVTRLPGGHLRFRRSDVEAMLATGSPTEAAS